MVVVDTRDHILSTFDRALSMYADEQFARQGIDVIHNSRVRDRSQCHGRARKCSFCQISTMCRARSGAICWRRSLAWGQGRRARQC